MSTSIYKTGFEIPDINPENVAFIDETQYDEAAQAKYLQDQKYDELEHNFDFNGYWKQIQDQEFQENKLAYMDGDLEAQDRELYTRQQVNYYDDVYNCTFTGECKDELSNMFTNTETNWSYKDLVNNKPLLEAAARAYGAYDADMNLRSRQDLVDLFMEDWSETFVNITKLGFGVEELEKATDQQKEDFALMMLTYDKVQATGEGSRDLLTQTKDVVSGLLKDPTTYMVWGKLAGEGAKVYGKKALLDYFKNFTKDKFARSFGKNGIIGGTYAGVDDLLRQTAEMDAGLRDSVDWGRFAGYSSMGVGLGGTFGLLMTGVSSKFNSSMDKWMVKNNLNNREALEFLRDNVNDEKSYNTFLKNLGWTRKEIIEEFEFLKSGKYKFDDSVKAWVPQNPDFATHKSRMDVRTGETHHFVEKFGEKAGKDTFGTIEPNQVIKDAQKLIDEDYVIQTDKTLELPYRKYGQRIFDWANERIKDKMNAFLGPDSILIRSGLRKYATAINDAMTSAHINTGRITSDLSAFIKKNAENLGDDLEGLWRNRGDKKVFAKYNKQQKELINKLEKYHKQQVEFAYRNKIITEEQYHRFLNDKNYIPRVWNVKYLTESKGAKEFADFIKKLWAKDRDAAKRIITSITGEDKVSSDLINSRFNSSAIKAMFRNKVDKEQSVERSSHFEKKRKIILRPEDENLIDPFMAKFGDRWSMYFDDVIRRNEFASRFGANDEVIVNKLNSLTKEGRGLHRDNLREAYFSTVKDPRSKAVSALIEYPRVARGVSRVNAYQTVDKMGLAQILNATQSYVNGISYMLKGGNVGKSIIKMPLKTVVSTFSGILPKLTPRRLHNIRNSGVLGEIELNKIVNETALQSRIIDKEFKGPLKWLNEPTEFLRVTGFIPVETINRRIAAVMGHGHIQDLHSQLQRLVLKGKGMSKEAMKLEKKLKELGINGSKEKEYLTADDLAMGMYNMNRGVNFSGESFSLPSYWHGPFGKLFTKFKSFMYFQGKFVNRNILAPLIDDKNPAPAIAYLTAAGILGNEAGDIRDWMSGRDVKQNLSALEWLVRGLQNAGGAGLFFETMKNVADNGAGAVESIVGPISDLLYTAQDILNFDIAGAAQRALVPNYPFKEQVNEYLRSW